MAAQIIHAIITVALEAAAFGSSFCYLHAAAIMDAAVAVATTASSTHATTAMAAAASGSSGSCFSPASAATTAVAANQHSSM